MPSLISGESIKAIGEALGVTARSEIAAKLAEDIEYRTREVIQEAAKFARHSKRTKLTPSDINSALRVLNVEPLYGYSNSDPDRLRFGHAASSSLYYTNDKEVSLSDVLHMELPEAPVEPTLQCHWLAVEGVQPLSQYNPTLDGDLDASRSKKRKVGEPTQEVRTKVKHVLPKPLQLFFKQVVHAVKAPGSDLQAKVFNSLTEEPGLHQLLPYLSQLVADEVAKCLRQLPLLYSLMQLVEAILANSQHLHVEPYLHQLMPPILTCLLGKSLCEHPSQDHWGLREFSAQLLHTVCSRYGTAYPSLQPRITKTLTHALLDPLKPLSTHYGAIVGLTALGPETIKTLLAPNLKFYTKQLMPELETENAQKSFEARKCFNALSTAIGRLLHEKPEGDVPLLTDDEKLQWQELSELFGERIRPFSDESSSQAPSLLGTLL